MTLITRKHRYGVTRAHRLDATGILAQLALGHLIYVDRGRTAASINDMTISMPWLRLLQEARFIAPVHRQRRPDQGEWLSLTPHGHRFITTLKTQPAIRNPEVHQ